MSTVLGRHRRDEQPGFDVAGAIANLKTAITGCARAMDLCDRQEIAAWRLLAEERGRLVELDDMEIRLLRGTVAAMRGEMAL